METQLPPPWSPRSAPPPGVGRSAQSPALALLDDVRRLQRRLLGVEALCLGLAAGLLLGFAGAWLGSDAPRLARALLLAAPFATVGMTLGVGVLVARRRVGDATRTARAVARHLPELKEDLLAAVELSKALGERHDFSPELARAFLRDVDLRVRVHRARSLVDWARVRRSAFGCLLTLGTLALALVFRGAQLRAGLSRALGTAALQMAVSREPITGDFELTYHYPAHTGLDPKTVVGTAGDVTGPAGTEVVLKTHADRDVARAEIVVNGVTAPLVVEGRALRGGFVLDRPGQYHVVFRDRASVVAVGPDLPVRVEADALPTVRLTAPQPLLEVRPEEPVVPLRYEASDDYGLQGLELIFSLNQGGPQRKRLRLDEGRISRGDYAWDVRALALRPGQSVSYFLEVTDNDAVAGPKKGVSATQAFTLYSAAEHRRKSLERAAQLWEQLVRHLADRLEGAERKLAAAGDTLAPSRELDSRALGLAVEFSDFARALEVERDAPQDLLAAARNVGAELQADSLQISSLRRLLERFLSAQPVLAKEVSLRLVAAVAVDIRHSEKNVLYLESLLDRHRLEALRELTESMRDDRRELSRLLEEFSHSQEESVRDALLRQMASLRERMLDLQQRMSELARGIREEHLNREALEEMLGQEDFDSKLGELERLVREGKTDEARRKMQELAMQMDQFLESLEEGAEAADELADPELARKFDEFSRTLQDTARQQEHLAEQTKSVRDQYRDQARTRIARQGAALKSELTQRLRELETDYERLAGTRLGSRADEQRAQALQAVEQTLRALDATDFDLASEAADGLADRARDFAESAADHRRLDELFKNPIEARRESRQLDEMLARDARKAAEVARRLRTLFPQREQVSAGDRQKLSELQRAQKALEREAASLREGMEDINERAPVFDEEARQQVQQAGQRMAEAAQRLGEIDPSRGYGEQQSALETLRSLQAQLGQQRSRRGGGKGLPLPLPGRGGRERPTSTPEKVEIPEEDPNRAPREFRKDVMDAMKQGAPERYRDQNKRYYEELVK